MDGNGTVERVWQQAAGQPDAERAAHGFGSVVLDGVVLGGNGVAPAAWRYIACLWMDAALRTCRLCHRRLLSLPVLYYHRLPIWSVVHDPRPIGGRPDGLGNPGPGDVTGEYTGDAGNVGRNRYLGGRTGRASAGVALTAVERRALRDR